MILYRQCWGVGHGRLANVHVKTVKLILNF